MSAAASGPPRPVEEAAVAIGLGANLADPAGMIETALARLAATPALRLTARARLYLTEPQGGPPGQNWYHNTVALFRTALAPGEVLAALLQTEALLGRVRNERWGPRVIDLDLLTYGQSIIDEPPHLEVPHPRLAERHFVLAPLAEVAPDWRHPRLGRTVRELLRDLPRQGQAVKIVMPVSRGEITPRDRF